MQIARLLSLRATLNLWYPNREYRSIFDSAFYQGVLCDFLPNAEGVDLMETPFAEYMHELGGKRTGDIQKIAKRMKKNPYYTPEKSESGSVLVPVDIEVT